MAEDINCCNFSGNLTRDPELRMTANGTAVLTFTLAVNKRRKVNGEWTEKTNFPRCVIYGKRAEALSAYLRKGMKVFVTSALNEDTYEKDGRRVRSAEYEVEKLVMTGSRKQQPLDYKADIADEEIPF